MADEVEVLASAPEAAEPKGPTHREVLEQRFDKFVAAQSEGATSDALAGEKPAVETPAKPEAEAAVAKPEEATPNAEPAKIEVTPEQMRSPKFWGGLDAEGWKRMERDYPVATAHVKAGQAAGSAIVAEARKAAPQPPQERPDAIPSDEEFSEEYLEAVRLSQSLDEKESARGHRLLAKFNAQAVAKEIGVDPAQSKAHALAKAAYASAVGQMAELATYDMQELAAIVDADPALKFLVEEVGTEGAIARAMVSAGETLKEQKALAASAKTAAEAQAEADRKKTATLKVVQSNARPASADLVNGKGAAPAKQTAWEKKSERFDREVARQGGTRS